MHDRPRSDAFRDRADAGRRLAELLLLHQGPNTIVLGISKSGMPPAAEVANALGAPLDVVIVRKLGIPFLPHAGMGALGEGGVRVVDDVLAARVGVTQQEMDAVESLERAYLESRLVRYRGRRPPPDLNGRLALIVDDGITTGATAAVACTVARRLGAARVVLAAAVGVRAGVARIADTDDLHCLIEHDSERSLSSFFVDFAPTTDDDVVDLLDAGRRRLRARAAP